MIGALINLVKVNISFHLAPFNGAFDCSFGLPRQHKVLQQGIMNTTQQTKLFCLKSINQLKKLKRIDF